MDAHFKDKDIDRLLSGIMSRKETRRAEIHMKGCDSCRQRINVLSGILQGRKIDSSPGDHVRSAVLAEWHRINSRLTVKHKKTSILHWFAYGFAAIVLFLLSAYLVGTRIQHPADDNILSLASVKGEVLINTLPAEPNYKIKKGDTLTTAPDSSASLITGNYTLLVESSSVISIKETGSESGFVFSLISGSVTSSSEGNLKYSFICGDYRITPTGTEFRIEMSRWRLKVIVIRGAVFISGPGLKVEVPVGKMWVSDDTETTRPDDDEKTGNEKNSLIDNKPPDDKDEEKNTDGHKIKDTEDGTGKGNKIDPDEKRDFKQEIREDINEIKKERRRERQKKGGN